MTGNVHILINSYLNKTLKVPTFTILVSTIEMQLSLYVCNESGLDTAEAVHNTHVSQYHLPQHKTVLNYIVAHLNVYNFHTWRVVKNIFTRFLNYFVSLNNLSAYSKKKFFRYCVYIFICS